MIVIFSIFTPDPPWVFRALRRGSGVPRSCRLRFPRVSLVFSLHLYSGFTRLPALSDCSVVFLTKLGHVNRSKLT